MTDFTKSLIKVTSISEKHKISVPKLFIIKKKSIILEQIYS